MQWYEEEVQSLEARLKATPPVSGCTAFYGSSTIRMWTDLAADLGDERAVNLGFGGSTLAACAYFFNRLVPPVCPASLVIYAGDNDLGDGRSPEEVLQAFRDLTQLAASSLPGIPLGFISIKLSPARFALRQRIIRSNELIKEEIGANSAAYYIDLFAAMLDASGQPRKELFLEDGLHLSRAGYGVWTQQLQLYRNRIFTSPLPNLVRK